MTNPIYLIALGALFVGQSYAQNSGVAPIAESHFEVSERGANHRVWNKIMVRTDDQGRTVSTTNRAYTEIASGIHFMLNGEWQESKEEFVLQPGWAVARKGPHKVSLAYNLNTVGPVVTELPDGRTIRSQVLSLHYLDKSTGQSVKLAEVKDCVGAVLPPNQVIYTNAFSNLWADVRYTYTKAGIEQDVILRQRPPSPESLGLNSAATRLAVLSEFIDPPPNVKLVDVPSQITGATQSDSDTEVDFGTMRIGRGRAFSQSTNQFDIVRRKHTSVMKRWFKQNGRTFLLEQVSVPDVKAELDKLPLQASVGFKATRVMTAGIELPSRRKAVSTDKSLEIASITPNSPGYVLDYIQVNTSLTNYIFRGDTTYYISGPVTLYGTNYIEGGAVIKYAPYDWSQWTSGANLNFDGAARLVLKTSPYRPAVFTAKSDDSIGEIVSGSTGNPSTGSSSGLYGYSALCFASLNTDLDVHDVRISYSLYGLEIDGGTVRPVVRNSQFTHNSTAVYCDRTATLQNLLIYDSWRSIACFGATIDAVNLTIHGASKMFEAGTFNVTNSLFVAGGLVTSTNYVTTLNSVNSATNSAGTNVFQAVGTGFHYLKSDSPYRDIGTTNIGAALLADLAARTTYPPVFYLSNLFTADLNLTPQAERDTASPDLGYHYDPIDYLASQSFVTNASLTLSNGVVLANYPGSGLLVWNGTGIFCEGTPLSPNWVVAHNSVQEQAMLLGTSGGGPLFVYNSPNSIGRYQFTKFSQMAGSSGYNIFHQNSWAYSDLSVRNCEFYGGINQIGGSTNTSVSFFNNLFVRSSMQAISGAGYTNFLAYSNNLNWEGIARFGSSSSSNSWHVFNNAFDGSRPALSAFYVVNGNNAFYNSTFRLYPTNGYDQVSSNSLTYNLGPLGSYYQPTNSPLIDAGSKPAYEAGLIHYTSQASQVRELGSIVDIGYHYVALDSYGRPFDTDADGIPDYLETDSDDDGASDIDELVLGRNPIIAGSTSDTNSVLNLQIFTRSVFTEPEE